MRTSPPFAAAAAVALTKALAHAWFWKLLLLLIIHGANGKLDTNLVKQPTCPSAAATTADLHSHYYTEPAVYDCLEDLANQAEMQNTEVIAASVWVRAMSTLAGNNNYDEGNAAANDENDEDKNMIHCAAACGPDLSIFECKECVNTARDVRNAYCSYAPNATVVLGSCSIIHSTAKFNVKDTMSSLATNAIANANTNTNRNPNRVPHGHTVADDVTATADGAMETDGDKANCGTNLDGEHADPANADHCANTDMTTDGAKETIDINDANANANINGATENMNIDGANGNANTDGATENRKINGGNGDANINGATENTNINGANGDANIDSAGGHMNADGTNANVDGERANDANN